METKISLTLLRSWLKSAGRIALKKRRSLIFRLKSDDSLLTPVDLEIETYLLDQIRQAYPEHAILTEESGIQGKESEWAWIIDPIDGTRAYATGLPIWGISIGVLHRMKPYAGGFYMPMTGEIVFGDGQRAWYNGRRLGRVVPTDIGSPTAFVAVPSDLHRYYTLEFPRLRSFGSTAAHLSYVARGIALAVITRQVSLWDLAGLLPVFQVVGVEMAYLSGQPFQLEEVIDGRKLPEPLIAALPGAVDVVRQLVHPIKAAKPLTTDKNR